MVTIKKTKNQIRRERAKQKKLEPQNKKPATEDRPPHQAAANIKHEQTDDFEEGVKTEERVPVNDDSGKIFTSELDELLDNPIYSEFKSVFNKFHTDDAQTNNSDDNKGVIFYSDDENGDINPDSGSDSDSDFGSSKAKLSKRQIRIQNKIPLATLKSEARRPQVVEWYDVDAPDPKLLVYLKSLKNVVPVPAHWQVKREYLSSKRGVEKAPFQLPKFIMDTGIADMRDTTKADDAKLKQKMRERVQPKMGRLDIDYQKLHEAFFKFQTKPKLYKYGDTFYEGRDADDLDIAKFRPGHISNELRNALGIPNGAPPPWLINMKTMGPPPAYPHLKIPGINAPVEHGVEISDANGKDEDFNSDIQREPFGQIVSDDEEEEEESEEEEEKEDEVEDKVTYEAISEGEDAPTYVEDNRGKISITEYGGTANIPVQSSTNIDDDGKPKQLYHVIDEKKTNNAGFMGSDRGYNIPGNNKNEGEEDEIERYVQNKRSGNQNEAGTPKKFRF